MDPFMKHTLYSRYALEVLIYLATERNRVCRVWKIAQILRISHNNLRKIIADLSAAGYVKTTRGCGGGVVLKLDANTIQVGQIIRHVEGNGIAIKEWSARIGGTGSQIEGVFADAAMAYFRVLDGCSIADLAAARARPGLPAPVVEEAPCPGRSPRANGRPGGPDPTSPE
jgi:Rrf2 family nitric oxide-sensitive transcriptional repressor